MSELGKYDLIGTSPSMLKVYDAIGRVADSPATIYIAGESGTGKELVARALHKYSRRAEGPFLGVNVSAFTESLLESELFGVKPRTATGVGAHDGVFVEADGGTLFLDEIAEMPLPMQVKILRVIQERTVHPVGGDRRNPISFDARLVAAAASLAGKRPGIGKYCCWSHSLD